MLNKELFISFNRIKVFAVFVLLLAIPEFVLAQTCDCFDEVGCVPCEEGFTSISFEYTGNIGDTYTVEDEDGVIGSQLGSILTENIIINSRNPSIPFAGNFIVIIINSASEPPREVEISTSCSRIQLGKTYDNGNFTITKARSLAGPLCCEPEDTDQVDPEFVGFPQNVELSLESGCEVVYSWAQPTVIDDCGIAGFLPPVPANTQTFSLGIQYITYTAIDLSNNIFKDSFAVTVIDEVPPVISNMPTDIALIANENCQATASWTLPAATDNCAIAEFSSNLNAGATFSLGTTEVIYTATDNSGNITERSFNVVVTDNAPPTFTSFPADVSVAANNNCEAEVEWNLPLAADNCNNVALQGTHSPGNTFALGTTTVQYTATDGNGNSVTRSFKVTVADNSAPEFTTFPESFSISVGNSCEIPVTWNTPVAEDNCSSTAVELLAGSPQSGDIFNLGKSTISYKASDANGNEIIQSFEIEVVDDQDPVFTNCPEPIIVFADPLSCDALVEWDAPQATDNCALRGDVMSNLESGTRFAIGTTEVIYKATDDSGNEGFCRFNVVVQNNFEPEVENCPQDVNLELFDRAGVRHEWDEPIISLECASDLIINSSHEPGELFQEGSTEVQYFGEINGETVVFCSFTVNVEVAEIDFEVNQLMTPNGDGENDTWIISEIENFPNSSVTIVDRWGGEIYKAKGYNNENIVWDGSNKNGNLVPSGTYYYLIVVEFESSVVKKNGFIELIR